MKNKKQLIIGLIIGIILGIVLLIIIAVVANKIDYNEVKEINALNKIDFEISKKFENSAYGSSKYYSYYDKNISCRFRVNVYENDYNDYKDGKDYLKNRIYLTLSDKASEVKEVELNEYKWYYMTIENEEDKRYIYATLKDNMIYELEYEISDYANGDGTSDFCAKEYDNVISSIKFK